MIYVTMVLFPMVYYLEKPPHPPCRIVMASTTIYLTVVMFPVVYYLEKPSSLTRTQTSLTLFPPARPHSPPLLAPSPCSCNEEAA